MHKYLLLALFLSVSAIAQNQPIYQYNPPPPHQSAPSDQFIIQPQSFDPVQNRQQQKQTDWQCMNDCTKRYSYQWCEKRCSY